MGAKEIFSLLQAGEIDAGEARRRLLAHLETLRTLPTAPHGEVDGAAPLPVGTDDGDIAVIGLNGRFPMAADIDEFWSNLVKGADCISEIPKSRWDDDAYYSAEKGAAGKSCCRWGGFIADVDEFDPLFFNISPRDAELIDPQERKFMEVVWETLEQAGYTRKRIRERLNGEVGVFVGAMYQQYHAFEAELPKKALVALSSYGSIANRVSYFLDLRGPSVALDTMCSSASVAIDAACQSLHSGACRMAIAGAANLSIHPYKYVALSQTQMLSSDRERRSFSEGDGFIPSEVVASVLLKPLAAAQTDGDRILAVIKSIAVRHKGRSEGFTVPELGSQISLLEEHFAKAKIEPESIGYVESSASGSPTSDAVEFAALKHVFDKPGAGFRCALGSVKANIGHAEAAAGMAQLAKVVMQLHYRRLVPSIKHAPLNPDISFADTPLHLVESPTAWEQPVRRSPAGQVAVPRRACINTFGAGGTNCHIIVEEYVAPPERREAGARDRFPPVFVFSAHRRNSLLALVRKYREFFEHNRDVSLMNVAYTLQLGREEMDHRLAVIARDSAELTDALLDAERLWPAAAGPLRSGSLLLDAVRGDRGDAGASAETAAAAAGSGREDESSYRALAESWVRGAPVEWEKFYEGTTARFIPLPTYTFARKRYWLGGRQTPPDKQPPVITADGRTSMPAAGGEVDISRRRIGELIEAVLTQALALQPDEALDWNATFVELGADSLTLTGLGRKIEAELSIRLKNRDFLLYRTVNALSHYLTERARGGSHAPTATTRAVGAGNSQLTDSARP
ncbi:MAG TPA: beta-ketoacyl synthase N-terminal-like domain-containing protein [Pyrinomonadaceae bacterium]